MKDPAFPTIWIEDENKVYPGMSRRFYAACAAMQGLQAALANPGALNNTKQSKSEIVNTLVTVAYQFADELIKQEGAE